jgi:hypothetical protein
MNLSEAAEHLNGPPVPVGGMPEMAEMQDRPPALDGTRALGGLLAGPDEISMAEELSGRLALGVPNELPGREAHVLLPGAALNEPPVSPLPFSVAQRHRRPSPPPSRG